MIERNGEVEQNSLHQLIERMKPLHVMLEQNTYIMDTTKRLKLIIEDAQEKEAILFLGKERVGKTTLINALLGRELLSVSTKNPTSVNTFIKYGERECMKAYFLDGMIATFDLDKIELLTTGDTFSAQIIREHLDYIEIYIQHELLQHATIVDTISLQAGAENTAYFSSIILERVQEVFWVLRNGSPATEEEYNLLVNMNQQNIKPYFVVNATDQRGIAASDFVKEELARYGELCKKMISVSAIQAIEAKKTNNTQLLIDSNITQLTQLIKEVGNDPAKKSQHTAERFSKWLSRFLSELQMIPERDPYLSALTNVKKYVEEANVEFSLQQRDKAILAAFEEDYKQASQVLKSVQTLYQLLQVLATELYLRDETIEQFEAQAIAYQEAVRDYRKGHTEYMQLLSQVEKQFEKTYAIDLREGLRNGVELSDLFKEQIERLDALQQRCAELFAMIKEKENDIFNQLYAVQNHITELAAARLKAILQQVNDISRQQQKERTFMQSYSDKLNEFTCIIEAQNFVRDAIRPFLQAENTLLASEQLEETLTAIDAISTLLLPHEHLNEQMPSLLNEHTIIKCDFDSKYKLQPLHLTEADVVSAELPELPAKLMS
ncbi:dynamin family protein [Lysinibacillus louembei]|uniref:Dynamin family protein n=1 Tax=Lysinibacillus louembei TaxID=1470088 RepID=A0ABZ0RUP1_9BACI|nr:dynamin family protein [Lysinibacillus louembei]WPK11026.1 dynamin family protein [Lysinibacillus louembei]